MADTAHKSPEAVKEFEEEPSVLREKARKLAQWIRESNHVVAFTGAGVSTSAGIPDFRGPNGVWTLRAQGKQVPRGKASSCIPTPTHMALVALQRAGILKFLVSQNTDGLHRKSGFPKAQLAELHGNGGLEYCRDCKKEFMRDFRCRRAGNSVHDHNTGRKCLDCKGPLLDSIINFGESLPVKHLSAGEEHGEKADLMLVLGSSCTVTPAADIPASTAEHGGRLVICNMQKTPLDRLAKLRVFGKTDAFMQAVMEELGLEIPQWQLVRRFAVVVEEKKEAKDRMRLTFLAEDANGLPLSLFSKLEVGDAKPLTAEPFRCEVKRSEKPVRCVLHFFSNYEEPPFRVDVGVSKPGRQSYQIRFDLSLKDWQRVVAE